MATGTAQHPSSSPERKRIGDAAPGGALRRRLVLMRAVAPEGARGPSSALLPAEIRTFVADALRVRRRQLPLPVAKNPRVVVLLPGFGTRPWRMRHMAGALESAGHTVTDWGLGLNLGPTAENFDQLSARVCALRERYGQKVVLVGWSLGGIFAREVAKRHPDAIARVITMGTPFSGSLYGNNAWRLYQLVTGHSVEQPPVEAQVAVKPPVETIALWSARDGIVSPRCACGRPGERDRAVALRCTHIGFAGSAEAIRAVALELDRPI